MAKLGNDASGKLFDHIIENLKLKNDADLARRLKLAPPVISKIRHSRIGVSADVLVRIHERLGYDFPTMRKLLPKADKKAA